MRSHARLGTLAVALAALAAHAQPAANVRLDPVREEVVAQQRDATGQIVTLRRSVVATQEAGLVLQMDLEPGDAVEQGAVIARLDDDRARLELQRWEARLEADRALIQQREAEMARAERDLVRIEQLATRASAGESELDQARTDVQSRKAQLAEAQATLRTSEAELALARRALEDMTIRAPFDGSVVSKLTEEGQWVSQGAGLVTIVSLTQLEARADIPERSVGALQVGDRAIELKIPALGMRLQGELIHIVPEADSLSRLFPIRIRVSDPQGRLRPGMSLTAVVPTGESGPALTISEDAILRNAAGEYVFFDAGGTAQVAPITRLFSTDGRVAVRSPMLRAGTLLVVEGNERMFPSQPLNVLNADLFPEVAERQRIAAENAANGAPNGRGG
jgi:membrane fusion protein (multidrug efflux system)